MRTSPHRYRKSHTMWDHKHPAEVNFPPLPEPKLVLDSATPNGCKAELTWVVVTSPRQSARYLRKNNRQCRDRDWNPRPRVKSPTPNHYTTQPPTTPLQLDAHKVRVTSATTEIANLSGFGKHDDKTFWKISILTVELALRHATQQMLATDGWPRWLITLTMINTLRTQQQIKLHPGLKGAQICVLQLDLETELDILCTKNEVDKSSHSTVIAWVKNALNAKDQVSPTSNHF